MKSVSVSLRPLLLYHLFTHFPNTMRSVSVGNSDEEPAQIVCVKENSSGKCIKITIIVSALTMCIEKTVHSARAECVNNVNRF